MPQVIPKEVLAKGMFFIETGQRVGTFTVWKKDIVENPNTGGKKTYAGLALGTIWTAKQPGVLSTGHLPSHIQALARQCCRERGWPEDEWMSRLNARIIEIGKSNGLQPVLDKADIGEMYANAQNPANAQGTHGRSLSGKERVHAGESATKIVQIMTGDASALAQATARIQELEAKLAAAQAASEERKRSASPKDR